jgi:hypothetical protein
MHCPAAVAGSATLRSASWQLFAMASILPQRGHGGGGGRSLNFEYSKERGCRATGLSLLPATAVAVFHPIAAGCSSAQLALGCPMVVVELT